MTIRELMDLLVAQPDKSLIVKMMGCCSHCSQDIVQIVEYEDSPEAIVLTWEADE
jgi:hypothetical protein